MATLYVSNSASNGFAVGSDSNAGNTMSAPLLTIAAAVTAAATGDTVIVNSGTYDQGTSSLTFSKNCSYLPYEDEGVLITSTNATATLILTPTASVTPMNVGAFKVQNTGTPTRTVTSTGTNRAPLNITGMSILTGGSAQHFGIQSTALAVSITRMKLSGTIGSNGGIYMSVTPIAGCQVTIDGVVANLRGATAGTPAIRLDRANSSTVDVPVLIKNCTISVEVPVSAANTISGYGIRVNQINDPVVERNTVTINAPNSSAAESEGITISGTDATATALRGIVRYNTVTVNAPACRGIAIASDGTTTSETDDAEVYGNRVYGGFYDGSSTPHGISIGDCLRGRVYSNYVQGFAAGILLSENQDTATGAIVSGNVVYGAPYAGIFLKGNANATVVNNTVIQDSSVVGANFGAYGMIGIAAQTGNNLAAYIANNNLYAITPALRWVHGDNSQVATFAGKNNYYGVQPTSATPWNYNATTYATLAAWQVLETTATGVNPGSLFTSTYKVNNATLIEAGIPLPGNFSAFYDYYGKRFKNKPTVGAVEYNPAQRPLV